MCVLIDHGLVCHSTHPIKQFLALRHRDLDKLKSIFQQIDLDKDGKVSVEDYVMYLREPLSMASFVYQIFALSSNGNIKLDKYDKLNETPFMDVGSTLKATAVFWMQGMDAFPMKTLRSFLHPSIPDIVMNMLHEH
jgi:hypothetical protein